MPPFRFTMLAVLENLVGLVRDLGPSALGTLVGALTAFRLQRAEREREAHAKELAAGNRALFVLAAQATALRNVRHQGLEPNRSLSRREFRIPHLIQAKQRLSLEFNELMFLLNSPDSNLVQRLLAAELCFKTADDALEARNRARLALEDSVGGQSAQDGKTIDEVIKSVPPHLTSRLKSLTDSLYDTVDDGIARLEAAMNELEAALAVMFPGEKHLQISPITEPPKAPATAVGQARVGRTGLVTFLRGAMQRLVHRKAATTSRTDPGVEQ